jgi:hypothetical protein
MYFVLKQVQENGRTYDYNVRVGGFLSEKTAIGSAIRHSANHDSPGWAIVKDHTRTIVGIAKKGGFIRV